MKVKYQNITVWNDDHHSDIILGEYSPGLVINLEIAKELVQNRMDFTDGKPHYVLIDFTNVKVVTKDAREFMNSLDGGLKGIVAGAFISTNSLGNFFINLYLKINKPTIPARFFSSKIDALAWLRKLKAETTQ